MNTPLLGAAQNDGAIDLVSMTVIVIPARKFGVLRQKIILDLCDRALFSQVIAHDDR
jgi:hypothetical protein